MRLPPDAFPVFTSEDHLDHRHDRDQLRDVAENGPARIGDSRARHYCAEIGLGPAFIVHEKNGLPGGTLHVVLREDT
ncbi:hypothetical protein [Amycolatopsis speibonae]|uniref:Uncharacterized protein n=1 Tax=Amycolatopsis speibonae TaxID=1450224 RepID=A0ABV7NR36_9PSEU